MTNKTQTPDLNQAGRPIKSIRVPLAGTVGDKEKVELFEDKEAKEINGSRP